MGSPNFYWIIFPIFDRQSAYLQESEKQQILHNWSLINCGRLVKRASI